MLKLLDFHNIYRKVMKIGRWELGQGFFSFLFFQIYQTIGDYKVYMFNYVQGVPQNVTVGE